MDILSYNEVLEVVKRDFPSDINRVLKILGDYGIQASEKEVTRVQVAILNLSCKDFEKLKYYVSVAKKDYRDVLLWGE